MFLWLYVKHLHLDATLDTVWFKVPAIWLTVFVSTTVAVYLLRKIPLARYVT